MKLGYKPNEDNIKLQITQFTDLSTGNDVISRLKAIGIPWEVNIFSYDEAEIGIEIPAHSLMLGSKIEFTLRAQFSDKLLNIEVLGIIRELEKVDEKNSRLKIELRQYPIDVWNELLKSFNQRQNNVMEKLKHLKGEI